LAVQLPNGVTLALATAYGSDLTVSALTNANPAVATSTAHGLTNGDFVVVTSGWSRLDGRVLRVSGVSTNAFSLEGFDTSSTSIYPSGSGIGTVKKVTTWQQITQVLDLQTNGGDLQFTTYAFLENDYETQLPTVAAPQSLAITIADDASLAGYVAIKAAAEARALRALKLTFPSGSLALYNGYVGFNETPTMTKNQVMGVKGSFSLQNRPIRYAS
jgi:hypothetical protein